MKYFNRFIDDYFPWLCGGLLLLWILDPAFATGRPDPEQEQSQRQGQEQHQGQAQGQSQSADASADSYSNSSAYAGSSTASNGDQSVTFTSPENRNIRLRSTGNAYAPSIDPSHPCALTWSGGVGGTGFSLSGGKAYIDDECNARETSRLFYEYGERDKAIMILCNQPSASMLEGCKPYQDYTREMKLLSRGHDLLVEENTELRRRIELLNQEYSENEERRKSELTECKTENEMVKDKCFGAK